MHLTNGPILKNETRTSETCQRSHKSLLKKLFSNDHKHLDKLWSSKTRTFKCYLCIAYAYQCSNILSLSFRLDIVNVNKNTYGIYSHDYARLPEK